MLFLGSRLQVGLLTVFVSKDVGPILWDEELTFHTVDDEQAVLVCCLVVPEENLVRDACPVLLYHNVVGLVLVGKEMSIHVLVEDTQFLLTISVSIPS